jgi:hypothetical protein
LEDTTPQTRRRGYPFLVVLGLEALFVFYLILGHRGVIGHDAFQYFGLQYYFLNNAVNSGETAQWLPLTTHGAVSNWMYGVQSGILQSALLALGSLSRVFAGWNFLPIYYVGILFDVALFLLGVCLLGRRYFASDLTILFVAIASAGSAAWFTQPWYNLHLYFALPLIFHFIHSLLESGKWRYFFLAGNLFALQCHGNLPYFVPFTSLIIFLYTLFHVLFFWKTAKLQLAVLFRSWKWAIVPVLSVLGSFCTIGFVWLYGTEWIANYNVDRALDGSVSVQTFLTYGTNSNLRWFELLSRVSPSLDYSVYFGYLALAFTLLALILKPARHLLVVGCTTVTVLLVVSATPVATLFYYTWPAMQYYRHLSLASTVVRCLLCFVAGFAFEQILLFPAKEHKAKVRIAILAMAEFALMLLIFSRSYERSVVWLGSTIVGSVHLDRTVLEEPYLLHAILRASLWCLGATAFFALVASRRVRGRDLALAAIVFQALDIYSFKFDLAQFRTVQLTAEEYEASRFQKMPFSPRRRPVDYEGDSRAMRVPQNRYTKGVQYWTADSYMFTDPPANLGRTDHWLLPFDDFLRAYGGEDLRDLRHRPSAFRPYDSFVFPADHVSAGKLAGVTEDKIQFFSRAHSLARDSQIAKVLASKSYGGDVLLISGINDEHLASVEGGERLHLAYDVVRYDSNNIEIRVRDAKAGNWLYYADCWHPFWQVTVNGRDAAYSKASLAYKAVPLEEAENLVHFRFQSIPLWISLTLSNWNGLLWMILIPCLAIRALRFN